MRKEILKILNEYAKEKALEFGYELEKQEIYDPLQDPHPINNKENIEIEQVRYIEPGTKENIGYIETRQRWGTPRIDIYGKNKEWFCSFEFDENGKFSSSQIFYEKGIEKYLELYSTLKTRINNFLNNK